MKVVVLAGREEQWATYQSICPLFPLLEWYGGAAVPPMIVAE